MTGKVSDMCSIRMSDYEHQGEVPSVFGIGNGDYIKFSYCADCGQMGGNAFPLNQPTQKCPACEDGEIMENGMCDSDYCDYSIHAVEE